MARAEVSVKVADLEPVKAAFKEAAATIEKLRAENDRLRAALVEIQFADCCYDTRVLADEALESA